MKHIITFYNFFVLLKKTGLKTILREIKSCIRKLILKTTDSEAGVYLARYSRRLCSIPCICTTDTIKRVNLITDSIQKDSLFGGVATSLIIASEFAVSLNMPLRIVTRNQEADPINYYNIIELNKIQRPWSVSFFFDCPRDTTGSGGAELDISPDDIFIATSWWTAFAIKKMLLPIGIMSFFYIIQEVETFFYPHGIEHFLCSTIMNDENVNFIVNSGYLFEYFKKNIPNIYRHGTVFEPAFPAFHPGKFEKRTKYKMFFYARPNNPRNMFLYGVYMLNKCISSGILNTKEWDIFFLGHDIPDLYFSDNSRPIIKGILDWKDYAEFLKDIDLALSLMYTPHPSYPPFDVAASGGVVLSNKCFNKTEFPFSQNVILSDLQEDVFLQNMRKAIDLAKDTEKRKANYDNSTISRSWQENLNAVLGYMQKKPKDA
jgi:hypothetical protein